MLAEYAGVAGADVIRQLHLLAEPMRGMRVVHISSTRQGGGVAEILEKLVPLTTELGLDARWEVMEGSPDFYRCTKLFHNALQGQESHVPAGLIQEYERVTRLNAERLGDLLEAADVVFVHDPQPAGLLRLLPRRRGKWIWRCHIDASHPVRPVWAYLRSLVAEYDASVFSLADFAQMLPHPSYLIPPSIDPLSAKNVELSAGEIAGCCARFGLDPTRPLVVQVSRFDRFKDPLGVVVAFRLAQSFVPGLQLVLAGGGAADDPEGEAVLREVEAAAGGDPDIHLLLLPADANAEINALQRAADVVVQKSLREGFGLTVTEALWKARPVIGGNTGGIRLQVVDHQTGFLVSSPEGTALRLRHLLHDRRRSAEMGLAGREHVRENFLITRQLREYLTLMLGLVRGDADRIDLV